MSNNVNNDNQIKHPPHTKKFKRFIILLIFFFFLTFLIFFKITFPFIIALLIVYIFYPLINFLEKKKIPRTLSVIFCYIFIFCILIGFFLYVVPIIQLESKKVYKTTKQLITNFPYYYKKIEEQLDKLFNILPIDEQKYDLITPEMTNAKGNQIEFSLKKKGNNGYILEIPNIEIEQIENERIVLKFSENGRSVEKMSEEPQFRLKYEIGKTIQSTIIKLSNFFIENIFKVINFIIKRIITILMGLFILFVVSAFTLVDLRKIEYFIMTHLSKEIWNNLVELWKLIDKGLAGTLRGQLVICIVNGILSGIGFYIFIPDYALLLAIIAGILSFIPIFGSIISTIPAVLVGLTVSLKTAIFVLLWIIVIHLIEANLLNPKIIGTAAKIHPAIVIFVLIAGEWSFGIAGALLAVPVTAIIKAIITFLYRKININV